MTNPLETSNHRLTSLTNNHQDFNLSTVNTTTNDGDDDEIDLQALWLILKRRKGTIVLLALLVFIGVAIATFMMKPVYRSNVTLQIDTENQKVLDFDVEAGNSRPVDSKDFYQTQYELLKSRSLARMTIDSLSLESYFQEQKLAKPFYAEALEKLKTDFFGKVENDTTETVENNDQKPKKLGQRPIEDRLLANVTVSPVKNSRIVTISYDDSDPEMATAIANSMAENFIQMNLTRRKDAASYAENFLKNELANAKSKLEESEAKLVSFAKKEDIVKMDDESQGSLTSQTMAALNSALTVAQQDRISAESKFKQAQATAYAKVLDNSTVQELTKTLTKLQSDYQEKLQIYKPEYPLMLQLESQMNEIRENINQANTQIKNTVTGSLQADYLAAKQKEEDLRKKLEQQQSELMTLRDKSIGYNTLQREVETNRNMYEGLLQRIKEVGVAGGIGSNNISIVDPAILPFQQQKPNVKLNLTLGLVGGLFIGIVVAFLVEFIDDRIKTTADLERLLQLPILGVIPAVQRKKLSATDYSLISWKEPKSALAEACRSLGTNLSFATREGLPHTLNITSSMPSEAKTSTAINLAIVLSQANKRVLLIDADLRKPTLHQRLKLDNSSGLSNYLTYQAELSDIMQTTTVNNLMVITSGSLTPNPVEVLSSERLQTLLNLDKEKFDIIIVDSPPTIGLADALLISNRVAATIIVAAYSQSKKRILLDSIKRLHLAHANIIGTIFTKVRGNDSSGYGYDYHYYYSYGTNNKRLD